MYEDYPATGSHYKKIYSTFNMAAQHQGDDLPPRCISLLEEVKDLIEAQKNESSRTQSEHSQLVHRHWSRKFNRETRESCRIFGRYLHCIIPPVPHVQGLPPAKKSRVSFQVKETWTHEFFCLASTRATYKPSRAQNISLSSTKSTTVMHH